MRSVYTILLLTLFFGCKGYKEKNSNIINSKHKQVNTFNLEHSEIGNDIIIKPNKLDIIDSFLVIKDVKNINYAARLYNKGNFSLIKNFMVRGKGPSELNRPGFMEVDVKNKNIWIKDSGKQLVARFELDSILKDKNYLPYYYLKFDPELLFLRYCPLTDTSVAFYGNIGNNLVGILSKSKRVTYLGKKPEIGENITDADSKIRVYDMLIAKHPTEERLACVFEHQSKIIVLDMLTSEQMEFEGPQIKQVYKFNQYNRIVPQDLIQTFQSIKVDEKYIYCLFNGKTRLAHKGGGIEYNCCKKLIVYDWKGNQVANLVLDNDIIYFDLDYENNRILGMSMTTMNPVIEYSFDFNQLN